ncbi:hypothetical protein, partial [Jannaschia aquimarina]|uniref:hypothetical protein n=1 Tax=Jannaschia aquimarina TaxID=935700 RepID=UPI000B6FFC2B
MRERIAAGSSDSAIAAEFGVSRSTAHRLRSQMGKRRNEAAAHRVISTRLTDGEIADLDRLVASGAGKSRGAVLRKLVRHAGVLFEPRPDEGDFLTEADRHLSRLGGNFNQIAAALSASMRKIGRAEPSAEQVRAMHQAADEVAEIRRVLVAMLRHS